MLGRLKLRNIGALLLVGAILFLSAQRIECESQDNSVEPSLSYIILVDTSSSLRAQINEVIETGKIIARLNKPADETAIIKFVNKEKIETLQDFTHDKDALQKTLNDLYVEYGNTGIMDAVDSTARVLMKRREKLGGNTRFALILISDGDDRNSYFNRAEMVKRLKEMNVKLYSIGIVQGLERQGKSNQEKAIKLLREMAVGSNGQAYFPNSEGEIKAAVIKIFRDARK